MAQVATSLVVYTLAALISGRMRRELSGEGLTAFFTGAFAIGGIVATASILPMLRVSSASTQSATVEIPLLRTLRLALADFNYRRLLFWSWHLAFFQGLTQAVLTKYQIEMLRIPFHWFLAMNGLMLAIQAGLSPLAGRISDRFGDVRALFLSTWLVGLALVFPMLATLTTWPLMFGCYAVWGLFGVVNLCSQTLSLRIAPRSDNTAHLGLFRPISGLVAAGAGLAGGAALDFLFSQPSIRNSVYASAMSYHGILGLSLVGRLTAPLWLLGIRERTRGTSTDSD
jgi:MFS family permease